MWYDIGIIVNLIGTAQVKKKSSLAAYRRDKKKIVDSVKLGSGSNSKYTPEWFCYKHMYCFERDT